MMKIMQWEHIALAQRCCEGTIVNLVSMTTPDYKIKENVLTQTMGFLERALKHLEEVKSELKE